MFGVKDLYSLEKIIHFVLLLPRKVYPLVFYSPYKKHRIMREILLSLSTGTIVGIIFAFAKLPIPAPQAVSGIAGIVGIYLGFVGINYLLKFLG